MTHATRPTAGEESVGLLFSGEGETTAGESGSESSCVRELVQWRGFGARFQREEHVDLDI